MATLDLFTPEQLDEAVNTYNEDRERFDVAPKGNKRLGPFTIFCLVLNRTIGSGIFSVPPLVLSGTQSPAASIFIWTFAGVIMICGTLCWLELGLSIPFHTIRDSDGEVRTVSTPRSGGEKNFLEYIFKRPRLFITCVYGIMFIILGNLAGNAIAFGIYVTTAASPEYLNGAEINYPKGAIIGVAITALTFCAFVHIFSRQGGILLNNIFAVVKVGILIVIILLGFVHAGGRYLQRSTENFSQNITATVSINGTSIDQASSHNFNVSTSFKHVHGVGNFIQTFLLSIYPYSGFEQPFYVLSEVRNPRKIFPKYTLIAMSTVVVLFVLVNISYLCVVPKEVFTSGSPNNIDMAGVFFHDLFDENGSQKAKQAMSGLIAISILGNLIVMTFTAARVKQEIAKEGILPGSLFFASGYTTPWAWIRTRYQSGSSSHTSSNNTTVGIDLEDSREKSPIAALGLHLATSIILVATTASMQPNKAYSFLVTLYSYVNVAILGVIASGGLLYLKVDSWIRGEAGRNWARKVSFTPWLDPLHAVVYFVAMAIFTFAAFASPKIDVQGYPWWWAPTVGITSLLWGTVWWLALRAIEKKRRRRLHVERTARIEKDEYGNYIQILERVRINWPPDTGSENSSEAGSTIVETQDMP